MKISLACQSRGEVTDQIGIDRGVSLDRDWPAAPVGCFPALYQLRISANPGDWIVLIGVVIVERAFEFAALTWPAAITVIVAAVVLVGSCILVAVTVTIVFCVTWGAVKFPFASTGAIAPLAPAVETLQTTSEAPRESLAVN